MAQVNLRFCRNNGPISWGIRNITWSQWSHVEQALPNGYLGALLNGGVDLRNLDYAAHDEYALCHIDCTQEVVDKVSEFGKLQIGCGYDISAVLGIAFHRDWGHQRLWFCSELFCAQFDYAKDPLINIQEKRDRITPQDIWLNPRIVVDKLVTKNAFSSS